MQRSQSSMFCSSGQVTLRESEVNSMTGQIVNVINLGVLAVFKIHISTLPHQQLLLKKDLQLKLLLIPILRLASVLLELMQLISSSFILQADGQVTAGSSSPFL